MKKTLSLLFLIVICNYLSAQKTSIIDTVITECYYNYTFNQDSTNKFIKSEQEMVLQVGKRLSKFSSKNKLFTDSIFNSLKESAGDLTIAKYLPTLNKAITHYLCYYDVFKAYPHEKDVTTTAFFLGGSSYKIINNKHVAWNLINNSDSLIKGYKCKKAISYFGGRNYTAWYTLRIPISDGPYKFSGLPGLIVLLYDNNKEHLFCLDRVSNKNEGREIFINNTKYISVDSKKFAKVIHSLNQNLYIQFANNPNYEYPSEEAKMEVLNRILSKNNFIEKY